MKSKGSFYEPKNLEFEAERLMGGYYRLSPWFAVYSLARKIISRILNTYTAFQLIKLHPPLMNR